MVFTRHALEVQFKNPSQQTKIKNDQCFEPGLRRASQHHLQDTLVNIQINKGKLTLQNCKTTWTAVVFTLCS